MPVFCAIAFILHRSILLILIMRYSRKVISGSIVSTIRKPHYDYRVREALLIIGGSRYVRSAKNAGAFLILFPEDFLQADEKVLRKSLPFAIITML